ncbi:hypothetical protein JZ785_11615 [Alicyclobacillus curvatus]|nr:hypothetical protein JZ785_11615 [Alicyclobacillus curvatus]
MRNLAHLPCFLDMVQLGMALLDITLLDVTLPDITLLDVTLLDVTLLDVTPLDKARSGYAKLVQFHITESAKQPARIRCTALQC